ncbi:MAG TPA: hypothetical protein PKA46_00260 [Ferruginibacter sp.]|nr:hypothetical protein [Ferruginibacter sp.]
MKALFLSALLLMVGISSKSQTYTSSCTPSGNMEAIYRNDAYKLAIKRVHDIGSPFADSVNIPEIFVDSIENALYAIANMQFSPVADTIKNLFGHTDFLTGSDSTHIRDLNYPFGLKQVEVVVDNTTSWGAAWNAGNYYPTTNDTVNYLMSMYQLKIEPSAFQFYATKTIYVVSSPYAIQANALAKQFEHLSLVGAGYARALYQVGDGNSIRADFTNSGINLFFRYSCGDCPSGCTIGRNWYFKVQEQDCTVDYLSVEDWGNPMEWLTGACLDYNRAIVLCAGANEATLWGDVGNTTGDSFEWQVSADGIAFADIENDTHYSGTNTNALTVKNIPSSGYGFTYRCIRNGLKTKVSYTLKFQNTWRNIADTSWENPANWNCGLLPDSNTDVVIQSGTVVLHSDATVRSIYVSKDATLTVAGGKHLTVLH